jgi:hypothetical protein
VKTTPAREFFFSLNFFLVSAFPPLGFLNSSSPLPFRYRLPLFPFLPFHCAIDVFARRFKKKKKDLAKKNVTARYKSFDKKWSLRIIARRIHKQEEDADDE